MLLFFFVCISVLGVKVKEEERAAMAAQRQRDPKRRPKRSHGACRKIFSACQEEGETEEEAGQLFLHAATFGVALDNLPANVGE